MFTFGKSLTLTLSTQIYNPTVQYHGKTILTSGDSGARTWELSHGVGGISGSEHHSVGAERLRYKMIADCNSCCKSTRL